MSGSALGHHALGHRALGHRALGHRALAASIGWLAATVAQAAVSRAAATAGPPWRRPNYRGKPVDLTGGLAMCAGLTAATATSNAPARVKAGTLLATLGSGALGLIDDLAGDQGAKGLAGHLGELAHGHVTTGALKIVGIGAASLAAALVIPPGPSGRATSRGGRLADAVIRTGLIAGSANMINLLDLRPGRALKAAALPAVMFSAQQGPCGTQAAGTQAAGAQAAGTLAAGVVGAGAALAPADLGERTMLGDCGANALGAMLGVAACLGLARSAQGVALGGLVALTLASEKVSFSHVIDEVGVLARIDALGRHP